MAVEQVQINLEAQDNASFVVNGLTDSINKQVTAVENLKASSSSIGDAFSGATKQFSSGPTQADIDLLAKFSLAAVDTSGHVIELTQAEKQLVPEEESVGAAASNMGSMLEGAAGSIAKIALVATGLQNILYQIGAAIKQSVQDGMQYQQALIGVQTIANNFGITSQSLNKTLQDLTKNGILNQRDALEVLRLSYNRYETDGSTIIQEVTALENAMVGAGDGSKSLSQQVMEVVRGFTAMRSQAGDVVTGIGRLTDVIKAGEQATGLHSTAVGTDGKNLIEYAGIMEIAGKSTGALTQYLQTNAGQIEVARTQMANLSTQIGQALIPALSFLAQAFSTDTALGQTVVVIFQAVASAAVVATAALQSMAQAAGGVFGAIGALATGGIDAMNTSIAKTGDSIVNTWSTAFGKIDQIANGSADSVTASANKMAANVNNAALSATNSLQKVQDQIAQENASYSDANIKRSEDFKEKLADMIHAHQDKADSLQRDLDRENAAYAQANAKRLEDFNRTMDALNLSFSRQTRDNNQAVQKENEDYAEKKAQTNLEIQREEQKGVYIMGQWNSQANVQKLQDLRTTSAQEDDTHKENLAKLTQNLSDETQNYQIAVDEKTTIFNEETIAAKAAHDQQVADTQTALDAEKAILNAHLAEVAAAKDVAKKDDIQRAIDQYNEEKTAADKQHLEKLDRLGKQATELGGLVGDNLEKGVTPHINNISNDLDNLLKKSLQVSSIISSGHTLSDSDMRKQLGLWQFADGGIVPGPTGQAIPIIAHGGERITPTSGVDVNSRGMGSGVTINMTGPVSMNSQSDIRNLADQIIRQIGRRDELARLGIGY